MTVLAPQPTQRHRMLVWVIRAGADGLDGLTDIYPGDDAGPLPNGRTRLYELIADRHHIDIDPCDRAHRSVDHRGRERRLPSHKVYRYRHGPERECPTCPWRPAQLQLIEAV